MNKSDCSKIFCALLLPEPRETTNMMRKIKNNIFAIEAAPAAILKKPKIPATIAITRKVTVHLNIK